MERAAAVISIDTEMAWGLNHRPQVEYRYDDERQHLQRLVALLDRHQIPATWAVVGHLMLEKCEPVEGVKHPEIVRPGYDWFDGDWFDADPCSDADRHPTWYAPDVIELIGSARTGHEIASHGFSHIVAGDPGCSRATFDSEVRAALDAAADRGIEIRSFVHPRNRIGHVDVLVAHGIRAYRGRRPPASAASRWQRLLDRMVGSERTAVRPIAEEGIWNLPATILFDVDARPRTWRLWIRQVERRLAQAVTQRSLFHLWFHPHNLRAHPAVAFEVLDRLCRAVGAHRRRGELETLTMGALAAKLGAHEAVAGAPSRARRVRPASDR